jgi:Ser/Thr protein kinase RdoA (MazF antagonist)
VTISPESIPRFSAEEALAAGLDRYGICGPASALPSERDQNFLIRDAERGKLVLKIANREDSPELLDLQHQAMRRVSESCRDLQVQAILAARDGTDFASIHSASGVRHWVRVFEWIEGTVLAQYHPRGAAMMESIGTCMAQVDVALRDFSHPAMHRVLQWDLRHAGLARDKVALLHDPWRSRAQRAFDDWETIDWRSLRHGVIHGDANDYNVLTARGRMCGLLDFGDIVHSATACELAIALAYAMLHEHDPLGAAFTLIRAYHRHNPLTEPEQQVLFPLVIARLSASLCYSAHNRARNPHDPYQVVTEGAARALLDRLDGSAQKASAVVRAACAVRRNRSP